MTFHPRIKQQQQRRRRFLSKIGLLTMIISILTMSSQTKLVRAAFLVTRPSVCQMSFNHVPKANMKTSNCLHDEQERLLQRRARSAISRAAMTTSSSETSESESSPKDGKENNVKEVSNPVREEPVPIYQTEGLFAVDKPLNWTSNDMVSYIRGILERDARNRGAKPVKVSSRRNKSRIVRVGHGGTLDPLASGVLVIGVGKGTKELQGYLSGSKGYRAVGEFGFETTTLDMEGNVTKTGPYEHITREAIEATIPSFLGKIMQIPPIFSAIKKNGKKLYKSARAGVSADDIEIEPREVEIYRLELLDDNGTMELPKFEIDMECGGGTFVRSLIRDIGYQLDSVATTAKLQRTKQGQFTLDDCLQKDELSAESIYSEIEKFNKIRQEEQQQQQQEKNAETET